MKRRIHLIIVAAALALVAAACGGGETGAGETSTTVAPTSTPAPSTSTTAAPTTTSTAPTTTAPIDVPVGGIVIQGQLTAFSLDGSAVLVQTIEPGYMEPGCEGLPQEVVVRVPLSGDETSPAITGTDPAFKNGDFARDGHGRAVLVTSCEGYLGGIHVFDEQPDGTLQWVRSVDGPLADPPYDAVTDIAVVDADTAVASAVRWSATTSEAELIRIDLVDGTSEPIQPLVGPGKVVALSANRIAFEDGKTVRVVDLDGNEIGAYEAPTFAANTGGTRLVFFAAVVAVADQPGADLVDVPVPLADGEFVSHAAWSPDETRLALVVSGGDVDRLLLGEPGGEFGEVVAEGRMANPQFSPDGALIAFDRVDDGTVRIIATP